jgi:hypothetical protein
LDLEKVTKKNKKKKIHILNRTLIEANKINMHSNNNNKQAKQA